MMNERKREKEQKRGKKQKRLRRRILFDGFECKGAEEYLQEMAEKGWLLDEIKGGTCYFVPMEPGKLRYAVKVFDGASNDDLEPSETSLTYAEYCEKAGWHFVGSIGKLHFFYENQSGAVDIETDAKMELKAVVKYVFLRNGCLWILFPLMTIFDLMTMRFGRFMTNYSTMISLGMMIAVLLLAMIKLLSFLLWFIPNKRHVDRGERILYRGRASVRLNKYMIMIILLVFAIGLIVMSFNGDKLIALGILGFLIIVVGFIKALTTILRRLKTSSTLYLVISIASGIGISMVFVVCIVGGIIWFSIADNRGTVYEKTLKDGSVSIITSYQDKIPVTAQDLGISVNGIQNNEKSDEHTIFAADINYYSDFEPFNKEDEDSVGISYEIFTSPYDWIMGKYKNEKLYHDYLEFPQKWKSIDGGIWNALQVYCRHDTEEGSNIRASVRYLVFYQNAALDFRADKKDLDQKDITLICDKLHQEVSAIPASEAN